MSAKISLQAEHGQSAVIDSIVDSAEYLEVFGEQRGALRTVLELPRRSLNSGIPHARRS